MATRQDDLARRLAARLDKAPAKGRSMEAHLDDAVAAPATSGRSRRGATRERPAPARRAATRGSTRSQPSRPDERLPSHELTPSPTARLRRGAAGTTLRGHLVPDRLHRDARRRKVQLAAERASKVTWDDVMSTAISRLTDDPAAVDPILDELRSRPDEAGRRRLVQATVPADLDRRFVLAHLDLDERADGGVTLEQLWAAALVLWLDTAP